MCKIQIFRSRDLSCALKYQSVNLSWIIIKILCLSYRTIPRQNLKSTSIVIRESNRLRQWRCESHRPPPASVTLAFASPQLAPKHLNIFCRSVVTDLSSGGVKCGYHRRLLWRLHVNLGRYFHAIYFLF